MLIDWLAEEILSNLSSTIHEYFLAPDDAIRKMRIPRNTSTVSENPDWFREISLPRF